MAKKTATIGNKEKALIHVAKKQLGMTEEDYRGLLASVGAASSRDLTPGQFDALLQRLEAAGFEVRRSHRSARRSGMHRTVGRDRQACVDKIGAILADMELPWGYADGMARNMFGVDMLRFCNAEQTHKVMQALIVFQRRKGLA